MDALDATMAAALGAGRRPTAADFGSLSAILKAPEVVARSRFAPEFMALILEATDPQDEQVQAFSGLVVEGLADDIGINSLVDLAADRTPLPDLVEARWFDRWLDLAEDRNASASVRTAALRGALLTKRRSPRRALRLSASVVGYRNDDDAYFLAHAARVAGLLHAERPDDAIVEFLRDLLGVVGAADQASFELGMDQVGRAFGATDAREVLARLREARAHFDASAAGREARADARVLSFAIGLLDDFHCERVGGWTDRLQDLRREAFAYSAYAQLDGDFLSGAKAAEVSAWASLAIRLGSLAPNLDKPAWWDATRIIENEMLAVYSASRAIFMRSVDGGLEWLVRPRIEESVARQRMQLYVLRDWLGAHGTSGLSDAATELIARVEAACDGTGNAAPRGEAAERPTVAALLKRGDVPFEIQERITREVVADVNRLELLQLTPPIAEALATIFQAFEGIPYFDGNPNVRSVVRAVVYKTLLFLEGRMDPTPGLDPTVAYLFVQDGQGNPLEKELQQDFMRFMRTAKFGTVDELRGIAAGRADVVHLVNGIRFVTEIKREEEDASFANLLASYGDQTGLYQNTNIPIGILLVLDLTTKAGLSGHFRTLYRAEVGDLLGDGTTRGVLIIKVPARRIDPSTATRQAAREISKAKPVAAREEKASAKVAVDRARPRGHKRRGRT